MSGEARAWGYLALLGIGALLALAASLLSGCARSHDTSCPFVCEASALRCEGPNVTLRACEVAERGFRHVFCDARAGALETLDAPCTRACTAAGTCGIEDNPSTVDVLVCDCMEVR